MPSMLTCFLCHHPNAQVDGFSARIKPEPKDIEEEEEEGIGDVDLFALNPEPGQLSVNAKWLQHLQVRGGRLFQSYYAIL